MKIKYQAKDFAANINLLSEDQLKTAIHNSEKRLAALKARLKVIQTPEHTTEVRVVGFKGNEIVSEIAGELGDEHLEELCDDPRRFLFINRPTEGNERLSSSLKSVERVFGVIKGGKSNEVRTPTEPTAA